MGSKATQILQQVFPGLSEVYLAELAGVAELRDYAPGIDLCHEGQVEETFYVIISGAADVTKRFDADSERLLHRLGAGDFFGEVALVQQGPRIATVRTVEPTTVLEIGRGAFMNVLHRSASMAVRIMLQVSARLRDSDQRAIADLQRKNVELAQAYAALETQQQLRSAFLTTVAHELRTPLTAATGYLQLVNSGAVASQQAPEFLKTVANNLETVVHLVNSILFLQELEMITPEFKLLHVEDVVLEVVRDARERASASGLAIAVQIADGLPQVEGDSGGLGHAMSALLDNAIKFSPNGGEIAVRVCGNGGELRVEIRDPGIGFPMEQVETLFEPFTRVEATGGHLFGGVGLGLPIARQVVESHGGRIESQSKVGNGSRFTIVLPAAEGAIG